jgi:hypothetical protein
MLIIFTVTHAALKAMKLLKLVIAGKQQIVTGAYARSVIVRHATLNKRSD